LLAASHASTGRRMSTSALEAQYAPLEESRRGTLTRSSPAPPCARSSTTLSRPRHAFASLKEGPITLGLVEELQGLLVRGTAADTDQAGRIRTTQVLIGAHRGTRVSDARSYRGHPASNSSAGA